MPPGRFGAAHVFLLVDGYNLTAAKLQGLTDNVIAEMVETSGLGDSWKERSPTGVRDVELVQEGAFFDTDTGKSHDALSGSLPSSPQATPRLVVFGMAGKAIGAPFVGLEGAYTQRYEVVAQNGNLQRANTAYSVRGQRDEGSTIQPLEKKTADWNTQSDSIDYTGDLDQRAVPITSSSVANPSVITTGVPHGLAAGHRVLISGHSGSTLGIDGEHVVTVISATTFSIPVDVTVGGTGGTLVPANSLQGGVGYLQVTQFDGFTGFVGKLQHSADDTVYTDLVTFDGVTSAPAAQRKTVSGTCNRYLAFQGDVTGTGSITIFCGFARV